MDRLEGNKIGINEIISKVNEIVDWINSFEETNTIEKENN